MKVLGIKIDDMNEDQVVGKVGRWLEESQPRTIATIGPEFILTAQRDPEFKEILNRANLGVPDGFGLQLYAGVRNRVPGTDLMIRLCREAARNGWTVGLLGGEAGIAHKTQHELERLFPKLRVSFALDGTEADQTISLAHRTHVTKKAYEGDLLFVALGHPRQEELLNMLINANQKRMKANPLINFRVGMGVGGAFDYLSGNIPRAPKWLRDLGLEWMYRIFFERPGRRLQRLKRILRATIIFPLFLLKERLL